MHDGCFLRPPKYLDIDGPLVFLAGPIQGAPDWQSEARNMLWTSVPKVSIASPRREGNLTLAEQVDWESHYLRRAAKDGVILFWLANEKMRVAGRAYAQTSRFELGEWVTRREEDPSIKLVIGIDSKFSGGRYIAHRISRLQTVIPVVGTLDEAVRVTLGMLKGYTHQYTAYKPDA